MSEFKGIPITQSPGTAPVNDASGASIDASRPARSGEKYTTAQGFTAIRDGIRRSAGDATTMRKPAWLRAPMASGTEFAAVKNIVREHRLSTVCEEAKCPNIGECWNAGTATIMLMGSCAPGPAASAPSTRVTHGGGWTRRSRRIRRTRWS